HRHPAMPQRFDVILVDVQHLIGGLHGERVGRVYLDNPRDGPAVRQVEDRGHVVLGNDGTRVEGVLQEGIQGGSVRAGDVWADLGTDTVEHVALLARLGEYGPAERQVARG